MSDEQLQQIEQTSTPALGLSYTVELEGIPTQVTIKQESTRGNGSVELTGEAFSKNEIVFSGVADHLKIHTNGEIAGSQFNGELFPDADSVISFLKKVLPETLQFDQHDMIEMTLDVRMSGGNILGYSGVKPVAELEKLGAVVISAIRTPGGVSAEEDGIPGAWYPEMVRDPETGRFAIKTTDSGEVANPHGKFEPEANIAELTDSTDAATNKVSVVLRRDPETGQPIVLTAYPGEIAPPYPAKINTDAYSANSLQGSAREYWRNHAFMMFSK